MGDNILTSKIRPDSVLVNLDTLTKEDVIGCLAETLLEQGLVKNSFKEAAITRENNFATGLDTGEIGVAIPHTDREHVLCDAVAIATLNNPVTFIAMGTNDMPVNVRIVIMLAIASDDKQIDTLQAVMNLVQQQPLLEKLVCETSSNDLIQTLNEHCN
jgi:PTS system galactitol-specific IIA component